jgi:hypothetical protein
MQEEESHVNSWQLAGRQLAAKQLAAKQLAVGDL